MRTLFLIVRKSLANHALSTVVTVLSVALGVGLVMAVFNVSTQSRAAFAGGPVGFDAVLGARGSKLQLVLNTVFHLETSPGNLPWSLYETIAADRRIELAIPYAVGDNYRGYRIVGTTRELFTEFELVEGRGLEIPPPGRAFQPDKMEAVIGATVARDLELRIGDVIHPYHGIVFDERAKHAEQYVIVGLVEPTNSPSDRVIWIPIEGIYRMGGHVLRGSGEAYEPSPEAEIPDGHKEVSAVMLTFRGGNLQTGQSLAQEINNQGKVATLAWPIGGIMLELFDKLGWVSRVLELVAYLVVAVAAGGILASLTNSMNERRREFAILRALGAKRRTVFSAIVLEAGAISFFGSLVAFPVAAAILAVAAIVVRRQTGVVLEPFALHPAYLWAPVGAVVLGMLSGLLPAAQAYSTEVAKHLGATN
ncbi:MAG: ABC transporter permease [Planctomycetota bacterium]